MLIRNICGLLTIILLSFLTNTVSADSSASAQANNPLTNMTAFNRQNYYLGEITESDESTNQFWLRYAKPFP